MTSQSQPITASGTTPTLLKVDPVLKAIFLYCSETQTKLIHALLSEEEHVHCWRHKPVIIHLEMDSHLSSDTLARCRDIVEAVQCNITAVSIRMSFDVLMTHIEHDEVAALCRCILKCSDALWRLRLCIQYRHCHADSKWHQGLLLLARSLMDAHGHSRSTSLSLRGGDWIPFWKHNPSDFSAFATSLRNSRSLSQLQLEFGSLFAVHRDHSRIAAALFAAIAPRRGGGGGGGE